MKRLEWRMKLWRTWPGRKLEGWLDRRRWRRLSASQYPFRYTGPTMSFVKHGSPLRPVPGSRGGRGGLRCVTSDSQLEIIVHRKDTESR